MAQIRFKNESCISLGTVEGEEDLKPISGRWNINAPPEDGRCDCCGKPLSELKPFGKAGDPLVGDFDGALLIKTGRPMGPPDEEAEKIIDKFYENWETEEDYKKAWEALVAKYGEEEAKNLELRADAASQVGSSWECRDCIVLDVHEYFEKLAARYSQET